MNSLSPRKIRGDNFRSSPWQKALVKTMLVGASMHLGLLVVLALYRRNLDLLNVFNILGISLWWPETASGLTNFIFGWIIAICLYLASFFGQKR